MRDTRRLLISLLTLTSFLECKGAEIRPTVAFKRDTFAFANDTVFAYKGGRARLRRDEAERYTARCFVMCRAVVQFKKFARFEPNASPLKDSELAKRIREITRRPPWDDADNASERIVIPGVRNLRALSRVHTRVVQENIGLGWPTYFRPGNWRVLLPRLPGHQMRTKFRLDNILESGGCFVAYITTLPKDLAINHAILIFSRKRAVGGRSVYSVYDPTFPNSPRTLNWSNQDAAFSYPPNKTFVGGRVTVWHVYGAPLQ